MNEFEGGAWRRGSHSLALLLVRVASHQPCIHQSFRWRGLTLADSWVYDFYHLLQVALEALVLNERLVKGKASLSSQD